MGRLDAARRIRALAAVWGALLLLLPAPAHAVKVRVRGSAALEGRVVPHGEGVELRARVADDTNRPIGKAHVRLRVEPAPPRLAAATACGNTPSTAVQRTQREYIIDSSADGSLCVRLSEVPEAAKLRLSFDGSDDYDPRSLLLNVDRSRSPVTLRFEPPPATLALEREQHSIWVVSKSDVIASLEPQRLSVSLFLRELTGQEVELGKVNVSLGQRAQFLVPSASLGAPGPAQLIARFKGTAGLSSADTWTPVVRTTQVTLALEGPPSVDSSGGVRLDLSAVSLAGPVPTGSVEALSSGRSIASSPVRDGRATLNLTLAGDPGPARVSLRFLPSSPAWLASANLELDVPVPPPSPLGRVLLLVCAVGICAWLVRAWYRPGRREVVSRERTSIPSGMPMLELISAAPDGSGWRGRVLDAHDGSPVQNAVITLLIPAFSSNSVAANARTDAAGEFELGHVDYAGAEGSRFRIEAEWHTTLERPVPRPGSIAISMVSRRRSLVERLVKWTQRKGRPWSSDGGATPRHVIGVAESRANPEVARWASAVEQAAYGPQAPDADTERGIAAQQPGGAAHE